MKASLIVAAAFAASVHGAVIEARQRPRTSTRSASGPSGPDVEKCGLNAFVGHTAEALLFCSSILKGGTATQTITATSDETITTKTTVISTLYPPSAAPSSARPPITTISPTPSSTRVPPPPSSSTVQSPSPTSTPASCGIVGYTGSTAAYYFDSSGTKNTWAVCSDACKADNKCASFGYGEANCLLFDVPAAGNTNYNPMSPYTFYDVSCPKELPVKKRQVNISLGLDPSQISSACSCLITSGTPDKITTTTVTTGVKTTTTQTVTRTVSLLPGDGDLQ